MDKLNYLIRSATRQFKKAICPYCERNDYKTVKRKYLVTRLVECQNCNLLFRLPNDPVQFNDQFYQEEYFEGDGITTYMPKPEELKEMQVNNFSNTSKGIDNILPVIKSLISPVENIKLLDYGSSWGYISYSLKQNGINVQSYEISKPRAKYGNDHLGLDIKTSINELRSVNNIFFSSHVIEHVPSIKDMINNAIKLTRAEGPAYFIALSPNGSFERMESDPEDYHSNWGLVHPNYLSDKFYRKIFADYPYYLSSTPHDMDTIANWDKKEQYVGQMKGSELLIIVQLKSKG
jgi:2-polyprenyl-3-methyl-5-hydroxy-6-metoxy-1,4-benzoquinol methylase